MTNFPNFYVSGNSANTEALRKIRLEKEQKKEQLTDAKTSEQSEETSLNYEQNQSETMLDMLSYQSILNVGLGILNQAETSTSDNPSVENMDLVLPEELSPCGPLPYDFSYRTAIAQAVHECGLSIDDTSNLELHYIDGGNENIFMFEFNGKTYNVTTDENGNMKTVQEFENGTLLRSIEMTDNEKIESIYNGSSNPSQVNHYKLDSSGNPQPLPSSWEEYDSYGNLTREVSDIKYNENGQMDYWKESYPDGSSQIAFANASGGQISVPANGQLQVTYGGKNYIIKNTGSSDMSNINIQFTSLGYLKFSNSGSINDLHVTSPTVPTAPDNVPDKYEQIGNKVMIFQGNTDILTKSIEMTDTENIESIYNGSSNPSQVNHYKLDSSGNPQPLPSSWEEYDSYGNLTREVSDIKYNENGQMDYWKESYPDGSSQIAFANASGGQISVPANGQLQVTYGGKNYIIKNTSNEDITDTIILFFKMGYPMLENATLQWEEI